jgi:hypothetical protein
VLDVIEHQHRGGVGPQVAVQEIGEIAPGPAVRCALHPLVPDLRVEKVLASQRDLQKPAAAVRTFDPALKQGDAGGFIVRLVALPAGHLPSGLGHTSEYKESPDSRQRYREEKTEGEGCGAEIGNEQGWPAPRVAKPSRPAIRLMKRKESPP